MVTWIVFADGLDVRDTWTHILYGDIRTAPKHSYFSVVLVKRAKYLYLYILIPVIARLLLLSGQRMQQVMV